MKQIWTKSEFADCALWSCDRMLDVEWCLTWINIEGNLYAICQGGHHGIDDRAELQQQYDRVERLTKYPYKLSK